MFFEHRPGVQGTSLRLLLQPRKHTRTEIVFGNNGGDVAVWVVAVVAG
jgi:hypothetical protein